MNVTMISGGVVKTTKLTDRSIGLHSATYFIKRQVSVKITATKDGKVTLAAEVTPPVALASLMPGKRFFVKVSLNDFKGDSVAAFNTLMEEHKNMTALYKAVA